MDNKLRFIIAVVVGAAVSILLSSLFSLMAILGGVVAGQIAYDSRKTGALSAGHW